MFVPELDENFGFGPRFEPVLACHFRSRPWECGPISEPICMKFSANLFRDWAPIQSKVGIVTFCGTSPLCFKVEWRWNAPPQLLKRAILYNWEFEMCPISSLEQFVLILIVWALIFLRWGFYGIFQTSEPQKGSKEAWACLYFHEWYDVSLPIFMEGWCRQVCIQHSGNPVPCNSGHTILSGEVSCLRL